MLAERKWYPGTSRVPHALQTRYMSLPNPEPTIHQAEWRERRTRLVPALAILLVIGVLMGAWVGLFSFLTTRQSPST